MMLGYKCCGYFEVLGSVSKWSQIGVVSRMADSSAGGWVGYCLWISLTGVLSQAPHSPGTQRYIGYLRVRQTGGLTLGALSWNSDSYSDFVF